MSLCRCRFAWVMFGLSYPSVTLSLALRSGTKLRLEIAKDTHLAFCGVNGLDLVSGLCAATWPILNSTWEPLKKGKEGE